jgi:hypothetical protein
LPLDQGIAVFAVLPVTIIAEVKQGTQPGHVLEQIEAGVAHAVLNAFLAVFDRQQAEERTHGDVGQSDGGADLFGFGAADHAENALQVFHHLIGGDGHLGKIVKQRLGQSAQEMGLEMVEVELWHERSPRKVESLQSTGPAFS